MARPVGRPPVFGKQVKLRLTADDLTALRREALMAGVTPSDVMRRALAEHFRRERKRQKRRAARS